MSKEILVVDRINWESMRLLELKATIMKRYIELEALTKDEDHEIEYN